MTEEERIICKQFLNDADKTHSCNEYKLLMNLIEQETVSKESYNHEYFLRKELEEKVNRLEEQNSILQTAKVGTLISYATNSASGKHIKKKILPEYFKDVESGIKTFELRKDEDNIQPGDTLDLLEWDRDYTGRNIRCRVTYVLRDCSEYGLMNGYCIAGIEMIGAIVASEKDNPSESAEEHTEKENIIIKSVILKKCNERENAGYDTLTDSDIMDILEECRSHGIRLTRNELKAFGMD